MRSVKLVLRSLVRSWPVALAVAAGAAVLVPAPVASAQMRMGFGGMGMGINRVTKPELERYTRLLGLDQTQSAAVLDLHGAYDAEFEKAQKDFRSKMDQLRQDFQDTQDTSIWTKEFPTARDAFAARAEALEKSLFSDVKALLTADQAAKFPRVERANRRNHSMPQGMLAGESADLCEMVDALKLASTPEQLREALDRYEAEVDAALVARDAERKEIGDKMQAAFSNFQPGQMPDMQNTQKLFADMRKAGVKLRDINDRYAAQIQAALPEDKAAAFADKYRLEKFPAIYREPYVVKAMTAAAGFKDLDADKLTRIDSMLTAYRRDAQAHNEKWARLQTDAEKDGGGGDMPWMRFMGGGEPEDGELSQTKRARRKLDADTLDRLKALLTEEQLERLPERENDRMFQPGGPGRR